MFQPIFLGKKSWIYHNYGINRKSDPHGPGAKHPLFPNDYSTPRAKNAERQAPNVSLPLTALLPSRDPIPELGSRPVPGSGW